LIWFNIRILRARGHGSVFRGGLMEGLEVPSVRIAKGR
jgi:hypothetical protein